jgi:hypothetical protein
MLNEIIGRRRALTALPAIGSALGLLPTVARASMQASVPVGERNHKTVLLPLGVTPYWACSLVGFGRSGYEYLIQLGQTRALWANCCFLAMAVSEASEIPCVNDPRVAFYRGGFSPSDWRKRPGIVILIGEVLDPPFLESAKVVARVAHDAGHTVIVVPSIPLDAAIDNDRIAMVFDENAACVTLPQRFPIEDDETDLRLLMLEMDIAPLAIALEIHGAAAVAGRLRTAPGLYQVRSAEHSWDKTDPTGPDWDYLTSICTEDMRRRLPMPAFLSLKITTHPTRKLRSRIIRAAHRAFAPAKPLIALTSEYYDPWSDYRLTMNMMTRVA